MAIFKSTNARRNTGNSAHGGSSPVRRAQARIKRAAYVQPRLLLAGMALILAGSTWWAAAQTARPVNKNSQPKTAKLSDLPTMMAAYGKRRAEAALKQRTLSTVGNHRYSLTEVDITPNTPSDEREPAFSPNGDFIAFSSNGADTNGDGFIDSLNANGKYHLWVMQRTGRAQRQVTGFGVDAGRDQRRPSWSPDGNQLVYIDTINGVTQISVTRPFDDADASRAGIQPPIEQRTFFGGVKGGPSWNSNGQSIAFTSTIDPNPLGGPAVAEPSSIFTVSPTGSTSTVIRITGGTDDPVGQTTSDTNPCFSRVNQEILFFSSDREYGPNNVERQTQNGGRRIWMVNVNTGARRQVTDPTQRPVPDADVVDDFPATSSAATGINEKLAFQSNSRIDTSDKVGDVNVWSVEVDTSVQASQIAPSLLYTNYSNDTVQSFEAFTGNFVENAVEQGSAANLIGPSGITFTEFRHYSGGSSSFSVIGDATPDFLVTNREANRGNGEVNLFDGRTNQYARTAGGGGGLTHPSSVAIGFDGYIYVASGAPDLNRPVENTGLKSSNKVHRFDYSGTPRPSTPSGGSSPRAGSEFTTGDGVTNGIEGIAFGPDLTNDGTPELFVSAYSDNKINVYDGRYGTIIDAFKDGFVPAGVDGPVQPMGLTFDRFGNLYVASRGTNQILKYDGRTGAPLGSFLSSATPGLSQPKGLIFGPGNDLFVSSSGQIKRYDGTTGANKPAPGRTGAGFTPTITGTGYLAFNPSAYLPVVTDDGPVEGTGTAAVLESNLISSNDSFARSGLGQNALEDRVADQEPTWGSSETNASNLAQLAFASQRTHAAIPSGDITSSDPNSPVIVNPAPVSGPAANDNDIWTTASQDFTPPVLIPQGTGNEQTPFIAPGPQAPFAAPRTAETGLKAGGQLKIAFVLKEQESGLSPGSVYVQLKNADKPTFRERREFGNESIPIRAMLEQSPTAVATLGVTCRDDGPPRIENGVQVGSELQAGAVKGDGVYYCWVNTTAPLAAGDYYIDVFVTDNAGNYFPYDNVWGFSTRTFQKALDLPDLLVSDYTVGQLFPSILYPFENDGDWRFQDMDPVESYYLNNPGDAVNKDSGSGLNASIPQTFPTVNVWRVLCRGPVPSQVYDAFTPTIVNQYDPAIFANGRPANFPALTQGAVGTLPEKTRKLAVSRTGIVWATPYTGLVFAGPGTLLDPATQQNLTDFLNKGGRLFVSGRDVIYALSNQGTLQNTFMKNELQASWAGESLPYSRVIDSAEGYFSRWVYDKYFKVLQFPYNQLDNTDPPKRTDTFTDAAWNQDYLDNDWYYYTPQSTSTVIGFDTIGEGNGGSGTTVIPAYTAGGNRVGQRVEKVRSNGIESRVVLFTFGFEGVNRRYQVADKDWPLGMNVRYFVADEIVKYFKTGVISGTVTDASTNLPIPNFIVQATFTNSKGVTRVYMAVTDANGFYEFPGVEPSWPLGYIVKPGVYRVNNVERPLNPGYVTTTEYHPGVEGGLPYTGRDFRMIPVPQGSLSGKAVVSTGIGSTATNVMENGTVLLRSVSESSLFPGGGKYAQLARTDAGGRFSFSNVPPDVKMELVLNPDVEDIPVNTGLRAGYAGPRPEYGKRIVPDKNRPADISVPGGESFFVNDLISPTQTITTDTAIDDGPPIVVPFGVTVSGLVKNSVNGVETPVANSTVTLTAPAALGGAVYTTTTDAQGAYVFYDIPRNAVAANYTITATNGAAISNPKTVSISTQSSIVVPTIYFYKQDVAGDVSITENGSDVPAVGATITLTNSATGFSETTQSDANGHYSFSNVPGSTTPYTITGSKNGATGSLTVTVTDGQPVIVPLLKLKFTGIQGKAYLNNSPVAGADIFIVGNAAKQATSDANGNFSIPGAAAGTYDVYATYKGDRSANASVTVTAGAAGNVRVDLFLESITGKVQVQSNGATTNAVGATVTATNGTTTRTATTDANGNYTVTELTAGTYTVTASMAGDTTPALTPAPVLIRNGATTTVSNLLLKLRKVTGTVTVNGVGTSGATVRLLKGGTDFLPSVTSGANGAFTFTGVAAGTYTLRASKGTAVSPDVQVTFNRDTDPAPVELKLQQVNVSGRVLVNDVPTGGLTVTLAKAGSPSVTTTTMADGSYGFGEVGPGNYTVSATTGPNGATASQAITVVAGSNLVVPDLKLYLQTVTGTVTIAGTGAGGVKVELIDSAAAVKATTTTNASGGYSFTNVVAGTYTVKASPTEAISSKSSAAFTLTANGATTTVPAINFQTISGTITLNNSAISGATVRLKQGATVVASTTSDGAGKYRFVGVFSGAYTVEASLTSPAATNSAAVSPASLSGNTNGTANVNLSTGAATPTPTPTATATPTPSPTPTPDPATEDYQINKLYQISVPYADAEPASSTTTVFKAFGMNPSETVNGTTTTNFILRKWDALTQTYVTLSNGNDIIRRGEGYFVRPVARAFTMRKPATDPTRIPTNATTFEITLRKNPSLDPRDPNNGYNLIGFPFDPAKFSKVDWLSASVRMPDGTTYATVTDAYNNNKMSNELTTLADDGSGAYVDAPNIQKFKGYYVKTFVDGIVVTLKNPQP